MVKEEGVINGMRVLSNGFDASKIPDSAIEDFAKFMLEKLRENQKDERTV